MKVWTGKILRGKKFWPPASGVPGKGLSGCLVAEYRQTGGVTTALFTDTSRINSRFSARSSPCHRRLLGPFRGGAPEIRGASSEHAKKRGIRVFRSLRKKAALSSRPFRRIQTSFLCRRTPIPVFSICWWRRRKRYFALLEATNTTHQNGRATPELLHILSSAYSFHSFFFIDFHFFFLLLFFFFFLAYFLFFYYVFLY